MDKKDAFYAMRRLKQMYPSAYIGSSKIEWKIRAAVWRSNFENVPVQLVMDALEGWKNNHPEDGPPLVHQIAAMVLAVGDS